MVKTETAYTSSKYFKLSMQLASPMPTMALSEWSIEARDQSESFNFAGMPQAARLKMKDAKSMPIPIN